MDMDGGPCFGFDEEDDFDVNIAAAQGKDIHIFSSMVPDGAPNEEASLADFFDFENHPELLQDVSAKSNHQHFMEEVCMPCRGEGPMTILAAPSFAWGVIVF